MTYPLIKPSDARSWHLCRRRVWLENKGTIEVEPIKDEFNDLVIELGLQHEQATLEKLASTREVITATSIEDTVRMMEAKVDVIYQAQLLDEDEGFIGNPDFLIHHGNGAYQPADAKLSLDEGKTEIQVQIGFYRRMLGNELPGIVFLGDGSKESIGDESNPVTDRFIHEMRELLTSNSEPLARYAHSKCKACPFLLHCMPKFEAKGELTLLYGIDKRIAAGLEKSGILTIKQLANQNPEDIPDIPYLKGPSKKERAVLQAKSHLNGIVYQTNSIELPKGEWVHFDIEDYPLTENGQKHVYLWGFLLPNYSDNDFEYVWTDCEQQDEEGWLGFLNAVNSLRERYPSLVLAHYSRHELTTIEQYTDRYNMRDHETIKYLLGENSPLFDIQQPIKDSLVLPLFGYGLKDICKEKELVDFQWDDTASGSQWSIVQFHRFLSEHSSKKRSKLKSEILTYNRDDVRATRKLEEWLHEKQPCKVIFI